MKKHKIAFQFFQFIFSKTKASDSRPFVSGSNKKGKVTKFLSIPIPNSFLSAVEKANPLIILLSEAIS